MSSHVTKGEETTNTCAVSNAVVPVPGSWVDFKGDKVWFVGYAKQYLNGSAEVRSVIISVQHNLLEVCLHQIKPWVEASARARPMMILNDIYNKCVEIEESRAIAVGMIHIKEIRDLAARGLGLI